MYELVVISKTNIEPKAMHDTVSTVLKEVGGEVKNVEELGEKEFTYQIKGHVSGVYSTYDVEVAQDKVNELQQLLSFEDDVIRVMIIKKEE